MRLSANNNFKYFFPLLVFHLQFAMLTKNKKEATDGGVCADGFVPRQSPTSPNS